MNCKKQQKQFKPQGHLVRTNKTTNQLDFKNTFFCYLINSKNKFLV